MTVAERTQELVNALQANYDQNGYGDTKFDMKEGRKYIKICHYTPQESVHAFVDKKTGEMYKAASIKAPAKGVRFDLRIITQREEVLDKCDWAGGYLYKK